MIYLKVSAVVCISFFHENISTTRLLLKIGLHMFVKGWLFNDRCRVNAKKIKIKGFTEEWYLVIYRFFHLSGVYLCFRTTFKTLDKMWHSEYE